MKTIKRNHKSVSGRNAFFGKKTFNVHFTDTINKFRLTEVFPPELSQYSLEYCEMVQQLRRKDGFI